MTKIVSSLLLVAFCLSVTFFSLPQATAQDAAATTDASTVYIKVGEATLKKSLLAMPSFQFTGSGAGSRNQKLVESELFNVITNDLEVSSYFQFIKSNAFLEDTTKVGLRPLGVDSNGFKFDSWKQIGAEFLIRGGYSVIGDQLEFNAYVYFVPTQKLVFGKKYTGSIGTVRKIAHIFSNDVLEKLTGKKGMFLSKIAVASDSGGGKFKEIYIMDWDGYGAKKVTSHKSIALSPNWAPDNKSIVYTAFAFHAKMKSRNIDLFSYELNTDKRYLLSSRRGINSGAAYLPDGKNLLVTVSQSGNPDIYKMSADGSSLTPLTKGPGSAMNVEPSVSPKGDRIAFSSDRSGQPMIYVMNMDGTNVKRVTFAGRYNSSPAWSPDGKKIAFAGYDKTHFDIFTMDADGLNLERLTSAKKPSGKNADNEEPSFSPDGRHIMFTSNRTGSNQIYIVNVDGTGERRITADRANYFRPKWSGFID
jgi:TolB protein